MRAFALIVLTSLAARSSAQSAPARPTAGVSGRGAFWAISVADLSAASRWYAEKLGLKVVMESPKTENPAVVALEGNGLVVELIRNSASKPRAGDPILSRGLVKAGVIVDDFDATVAMLRAKSVPIAFGPYPARPGQRANVIVRDLEGNLIQFFGR
jgi:catechol 2,3-dioxygenase-like lactoylglutathione lyase family enzyme